jgi:hypothetical protein
MRRLTLILLVVASMSTSSAHASCIHAVVVDGVLLVAQEVDDGIRLPPVGGRRLAVVPACNDAGQSEPDGETTVVRFKDVRADIAVRSVDATYVYVARDASMTLLGDRVTFVGPRAERRRPSDEQRSDPFPWGPVAGTAVGMLLVAVAGRRLRAGER